MLAIVHPHRFDGEHDKGFHKAKKSPIRRVAPVGALIGALYGAPGR
jgi:hypothetical protein